MDSSRKNPKLNISQIAELAQVSKGTVSKVLNGQKGVGEQTRERIQKLVKELNYHQDASARALALQRTGIIGFLIPHAAPSSLAAFFWTSVLAGISHQAAAMGYNVLVLTPQREGDLQGTLMQALHRGVADGFIIGSELLDKELFSTLILQKVPFVLLGQNPEFSHFCIDDDNHQGVRDLLNHMIARGYKKIGALFGPEAYSYVRERRDAYLDTLRESGITWTAEGYSEYLTQDTVEATNRLMEEHPDMDALFVGSGDEFFLDALQTLRRRGKRFPEFGIAVYDDYPFLNYLTPPVTAVRQPLQESGKRALEMLVQIIKGDPPLQKLVRLQNEIIARESCGEGNLG
jgi:DNA-binding LacI/PurR family transcriptional regulator